MLFPAVLMNIPNSKVCLKGEWSITIAIACCHEMDGQNLVLDITNHAWTEFGIERDKSYTEAIKGARGGRILGGV